MATPHHGEWHAPDMTVDEMQQMHEIPEIQWREIIKKYLPILLENDDLYNYDFIKQLNKAQAGLDEIINYPKIILKYNETFKNLDINNIPEYKHVNKKLLLQIKKDYLQLDLVLWILSIFINSLENFEDDDDDNDVFLLAIHTFEKVRDICEAQYKYHINKLNEEQQELVRQMLHDALHAKHRAPMISDATAYDNPEEFIRTTNPAKSAAMNRIFHDPELESHIRSYLGPPLEKGGRRRRRTRRRRRRSRRQRRRTRRHH